VCTEEVKTVGKQLRVNIFTHERLAMDISADLTELGRSPVAVLAGGVKSILDIGRTLEYLVRILPISRMPPNPIHRKPKACQS
jgi:hypothetical protein